MGAKFLQRGNGRLHAIGESGAAGTDCIGGNGALLRQQTKSDETLGQFAIRLFPYEFISVMASPEINARALKEFASDAAEKLNQRIWIGAFRRLLGDTKKETLKGIVGIDVDSPGRTILR